MDLEVVGRHALLFDDDSMAAFVNSPAALVDWNCLSIDRYDVRHLLSAPPPPRNRRRVPDDSLESEIDHQRYLDLPSPSNKLELENEAEGENTGGCHAVAFSYGGPSETSDQKNADAESGFRPPFSVPEHLSQNLPPTEKVHQIIARTAMFVSRHGGQSEIVLRVKQGDNPTFGFLMPDHYLHPYFRFLVDHQEFINSVVDGKSIEEKKADSGLGQMSGIGGALSLLGSVYGSGEDEEGATEDSPAPTKHDSGAAVSHGSEQNNPSFDAALKDGALSKPPLPSLKERSHVIKRNRSISTVKAGTTAGVKKDGDSMGLVSSTVDKLQPSISPDLSKVEISIVEPPSDLKRVVDKIVEFILRNGKEFEGVLVQQDTKHGRFPFLLPSNQYHPYYLKTLQKAQGLRFAGRSFNLEEHDSLGNGLDKKIGSKENESLSLMSDIPYESDRKEKFKMVIGKSKKDGPDPSKATQPQVGVSVDAAAAAAILQAATKGIKNPNLEILSKTINGFDQGPRGDSRDSLLSSRLNSSNQKSDQDGEPGVSAPLAKAIAKTAAVAVASEADSEASLTREQKLKAERLKRAKMFAAMVKSGVAPLKSEPLHALSTEPSESAFSGSDSQLLHPVDRERESRLVPLDVDSCNTIEKSEKKGSADDQNERRSKRSYRSRSKRDEEEEEEQLKEDRDHKHSRKKRRSHHTSHHSKDKHKHRKKHSSLQDQESQHKHRNCSTSDDEHRHKREISSEDGCRQSGHRHRHDSSLDDERLSNQRRRHDSSSDEHGHSQHRHRHDSSSDGEYMNSRRSHRHDSDFYDHRHSEHLHKYSGSSGDERQSRAKSVKHKKISLSEIEADLEEGEILTKSDQSKVSEGGDGASREASVDLSKSYQELRPPSQQSDTAEVSNDLRAKIRAMLMATL